MRRIIALIVVIMFLPTGSLISADDQVSGGYIKETHIEIHKKKKEKVKKEKVKKELPSLKPITRGFESNITAGVNYLEEDDVVSVTLDYIGGYRFNNLLFVGLGVGAHIEDEDDYSIPIFAHARTYFSKTRWQPFIALSTGVEIIESYEETFYTTLYFEPAVGVNYRATSGFGINMQLGGGFIHGYYGLSFKLGCTF